MWRRHAAPATKGFVLPRYAALLYDLSSTQAEASPEHWADVFAQYGDFAANAGAAGVLSGGEALQPTETATTIHVKGGAKGGELVLADGPFAETKEVFTGFYLLDCADLAEAISWAAQIPAAWFGRVEVRPVIDFSQG
jgi:hypothetical protein